jgi:hypothetical protein
MERAHYKGSLCLNTACVHRSLEVCILFHFGDIDRTLSGLLQQHTVVAVSRGLAAAHHLHMEGASHLRPSNSTLRASNRGSIPRFGWSSIGPNLRSVPCGRHYHVAKQKCLKQEERQLFRHQWWHVRQSSASGDL